MRALFLAALVALPSAGAAQDRTLADIRQEMSVLYVEVQRLKRELSTTGAPEGSTGGGSVLQRIDAIEQELQRLTARTEELDFRIQQVVSDGTNRLGDLEFRLCELEPDCDIGQLKQGTTLGGGKMPDPAPPPAPPGAELAVGERDDFEAARAAHQQGEHQRAADLFAKFLETYPQGPLSGEANFFRGEALRAAGDVAEAAKAYLASYAGAPQGEHAPLALVRLGVSLGELGQTQEACLTLAEVSDRYPGSGAEAEARIAAKGYSCQ
ncbi:tol-pal system protein YbgF [Rhodovulum imhoffii]|uniref:Cell division coordinator CpoB n=1 Tax=Rhodovulum imhoffii TaxID=365340 RepID=A0A2T5BSV1_9RHOB|nr:tol-pal system protein YbgF [Rhodovulum imhoffii]MBK5932709.1 tol-pal system protein YbgF [Rhodovulum imhoffii]PTN02475.1 tol-pal system protein YbgF [Rhodovulum imhoffii]